MTNKTDNKTAPECCKKHHVSRADKLKLLCVGVLFIAVYAPTFVYLWNRWLHDSQYSLAFLVPFVSGYFIWRLWKQATSTRVDASPWGLGLIIAALLMHFVGTLLDVAVISGMSILVLLLGVCLHFRGSGFTKVLWFPLAYTVFMVPIPEGIIDLVGFPMQLWASMSTEKLLNLIGLEVFREGVRLVVGSFDFQVAAACSGMSSLVALVGVTAVFAYMTKLPAWLKWVLFFLSLPIALIANVVRITTIALVGYRWGADVAMNMYHDWSSPMLFMVAILLLALISRGFEYLAGAICHNKMPQAVEQDSVLSQTTRIRSPKYAIVLVLMAVMCAALYWVREKPAQVIFSPNLEEFPSVVQQWNATEVPITHTVRKLLNADNVLSRLYMKSEYGNQVGLLVVYRKYGRRDFIHRPELCYPAAGWQIVETGTATVPYDGKNITATKVVAEKNGAREVILYWFTSGDRVEHNFLTQQFRMAMDRFQSQRYGWAFIRINSPVISSDNETMGNMRSFTRSISKPLTNTLRSP
ncbi:MAG: exosortase C-terminal domain/associated protein EpsI [Armatimonadota bacterium]|nr:EpsI family protein [bacterium]